MCFVSHVYQNLISKPSLSQSMFQRIHVLDAKTRINVINPKSVGHQEDHNHIWIRCSNCQCGALYNIRDSSIKEITAELMIQ